MKHIPYRILIQVAKLELRNCSPRNRERYRLRLKAVEVARQIKKEVLVQSRAERAGLGLRSTGSGDVAA